MEIWSIAGHKGGIGKSCIATGVAQALVLLEKKVLLIDFEENNNATDICLDSSPSKADIPKRNLYTAISGAHSVKDVIWKNIPHGFDFVPTTGKIQLLDYMLNTDRSLSIRLAEEIKSLDYDFIIIDLHPSINSTMKFAFKLSDRVIAPLVDDTHNVKGLKDISAEISEIERETGKRNMLFVVRNLIPKNKADFLLDVARSLNFNIAETTIFKNASIHNAKNLCQPLSWTANDGVKLFLPLAKELLK
ncbi:CobQ/CobB/MinD/ParA nucleotide binding domain protein [Leptospira kirschneri]|uniref:ParA family protein n=1 Tax=Leptospira kirschneri TaxID=29507 RepID=UPI0002BD94CD|nr:ParA family protein [Leptospira kirschneri]EMK02926.1 CobQ/CobB/MinD/ParA nucleotide binding domain protein [Leptospira kirschneri]